jgi:Ca2+-binding RTX toxin-like protein
MGVVIVGPGLAGFPAFAPLNLGAIPPQELAGILQALDFQFTDDSFSFQLPASLFDLPDAHSYSFSFTGDFSSVVTYLADGGDPAGIFTDTALTVEFRSALATNLNTGLTAEGDVADANGIPVPFVAFFATLLNPVNFSQDILQDLTGNIAQFNTIDVSAFAKGVILTRPEGSPTVSTYGAIQAPGGGFEAAAYGVASFAGEVAKLDFGTVIGGPGNDILGTGTGDVTIDGGGGNDLLIGGAGVDVLEGGAGADTLIAGSGQNTLSGGGGADFLLGGSGTDVLTGGGGHDVLVAGGGSNTLVGGAGPDEFVIQHTPGAVTTIDGFDAAQGDRLLWDAGFDRLRIGHDKAGDLTVTVGRGDDSQEVIFKGDSSIAQILPGLVLPRWGDGALRFAGGSTGTVLLAAPSGGTVRADAANETLIGQGGRDTLIAGPGGDTLVAGSGNDVLKGGSGNDILLGGSGNDTLIAGSGDDVMDGGTGNATLIAGPGADVMTGGPGADTFVFRQLSATYGRITDFQPGVDKIDLSAMLKGITITASEFSNYVQLQPLGPTEYTGFLEVSTDGNPADAKVVAQLDGAAWQLTQTGGSLQAVSTLHMSDFIL